MDKDARLVLLQATLDEEAEADEKLTALAKSVINVQAEAAEEEVEEKPKAKKAAPKKAAPKKKAKS